MPRYDHSKGRHKIDLLEETSMAAMNRPWTAFYDVGARKEIVDPPFRSLADLCTATARVFSDQIAFTTVMPNGMFGNLTYAEVNRLSDDFAVYLRESAGCQVGDRVAIQVPNSLTYPIVAFGVFKAGCVLVNLNPLYTGEEMGRTLADARPQALVIIDMFADKLPRAMRDYAVPHVVVTRVAEFLPSVPRTVIGLVQKYWNKQVPAVEVPFITFEEAIQRGNGLLKGKKITVPSYTANVGPDTLACLQYTGGTTGVSKGAMLTHGNLLMNMAQTMEAVGQNIEKGKETVLTALPLYHIFAFTVNFLMMWWYGARNLLIPSPRPISNLRRAFENYPVTWITGVNTLFNALNNEHWFIDNPPKHLKCASAGGMALQGAVAARWTEITKTPVVEGFGLTETSPVLSFNPFGKAKDGSIGIPVPSTDMMIVDDNWGPVPPGTPGEIVAKGPQIMLGYWEKPEETAKVMHDGWFATGDIAIMDNDGYFKIVDRKKDMVLVSGFNVYPNEVEDVLVTHPGVLEAAVIGVPDGAAGEAVKAFVVLKDKSVTADQIKAFAREHLTAYKVPKQVEFRAELPKTNVGKILRKDLRAEELAKSGQKAA
jgi:long-chain acyl-CoA synthetase